MYFLIAPTPCMLKYPPKSLKASKSVLETMSISAGRRASSFFSTAFLGPTNGADNPSTISLQVYNRPKFVLTMLLSHTQGPETNLAPSVFRSIDSNICLQPKIFT
eukprot:TRINITY_DN3026_c0_g1_i1.p1 TRINITY_DN3026_c0_g1~~TRINITY_DN3026_c0_g1_i1.p1  ORF type:complete len:105 (-),score=5.71 TRINITY_DN3026_c0_g1_i1:289-603(-)